MGTTLVVAGLIIVVLLFIWLATTLIARGVEHTQGHDTCQFCGALLAHDGIEYVSPCATCGRDQPWATDAATT